jgi:8-oxo-dGTP diphosphatase
VSAVEVAAAVIERADGAVLLAQRPIGKVYAGYWEFPGGKVEAGEIPEAALEREIREELGVEISVGEELMGPDGGWPISEAYALHLYFATVTDGVLHRSEDHDELRRLAVDELGDVDWLPSDLQAITALRTAMESRSTTG